MKRVFIYCLVGVVFLSMTGCSTTDNAKDDTQDDSIQEPVVLKEGDTSNLDDLNVVSTLENETVKIKLLSSATLDNNGNMMLDDGNEFAVVASIDHKDFILLEKERIQIGVPKVSYYEDADGIPVIVVTDSRTAKYDIYEYTYNKETSEFTVQCLTENTNINFIGEI